MISDESGWYYIHPDGTPFTLAYESAFSMGESQDNFGRAKSENGWEIIYKDGSVVDSGFSVLNPLPGEFTIGTGMKDGKIVIFSLALSDDICEKYRYRIRASLEGYSEIFEPFRDDYAVVKGKSGYGVVDIDGVEIVPSVYHEIVIHEPVYSVRNKEQRIYVFVCSKQDGTGYDVLIWDALHNDKMSFNGQERYGERNV